MNEEYAIGLIEAKDKVIDLGLDHAAAARWNSRAAGACSRWQLDRRAATRGDAGCQFRQGSSPLDRRAALNFLKSKRNDDPDAEQYRPLLNEVAPGHFVAEHDPV